MRHIALTCALLASLTALGCSGHHGDDGVHPVLSDRLVSIDVEVYDPNTGFVWENVGVRIVNSEQEWSGLVLVNPVEDWYFADEFGTVLFDSDDLAIADVGFLLDGFDRAVLSPDGLEDEAIVLLEVYAPGLGSVFVDVDLSWDEPRVFVEIPY